MISTSDKSSFQCSPETPDLLLLQEYVDSVKWQFAKTMASIPHWYTIRAWSPGREEGMLRLAAAIHCHGFDKFAYGRWYRYIQVGEFIYWTQSEVHLMPRPQHVWLINRAKAIA